MDRPGVEERDVECSRMDARRVPGRGRREKNWVTWEGRKAGFGAVEVGLGLLLFEGCAGGKNVRIGRVLAWDWRRAARTLVWIKTLLRESQPCN